MSKNTSSRRSFFVKAGAAVSAPAALVAGTPANARSEGRLEGRIAALEDAQSLRRLCAGFIRDVNSGVQAEGFEREGVARIVADDFDRHASVVINDTRQGASLRLPCRVGVDVPIDAPGSVLVDMAKLQGEGYVRETRAQVLELSCVRDQSDWTITRAQLIDEA